MFSKTKRLKPAAITPPKSNRNTGSMITLYPSELQVTTSNDMSHLLLYEKYRRDPFSRSFCLHLFSTDSWRVSLKQLSFLSLGLERLVKMIKNKILWCGDGKQMKMLNMGEKRGRK